MKKYIITSFIFLSLLLIGLSSLLHSPSEAEKLLEENVEALAGDNYPEGTILRSGQVEILICHAKFDFSGPGNHQACSENSDRETRCPSVTANGRPLSEPRECYK